MLVIIYYLKYWRYNYKIINNKIINIREETLIKEVTNYLAYSQPNYPQTQYFPYTNIPTIIPLLIPTYYIILYYIIFTYLPDDNN